MIFELSSQNSIANHFVAELRDVDVQVDRMRFRKNLSRLGGVLAYELSKKLNFKNASITTPLGSNETMLLEEQPVLIPILRAGLPFYEGVVDYFDRADSGFIAAWRVENEDSTGLPEVELNYLAAPSVEGRTVILIDPMLATGKSLIVAYRKILTHGTPSNTHIISAIAAQAGVDYVMNEMGDQTSLWVGAVDEELNSQSYIVPGLGDAGDLSYGPKL